MTNQLKGAALTLIGGMCWGISGSVGQYLFTRQGMDSRWLVPVRLGLAGIILLIYGIIRFRGSVLDPWKNRYDRRDLIIYGVVGVSFSQFLYFLTIQLSTAGTGTILQDLSPVIILSLSCIVARRVPTAREIIAIFLALAGVFLIVTHGSLTNLSVSAAALSSGVLSAVCVTIYNMEPVHLLSKFSVMQLQSWAFLMGSALFSLMFRPWRFHCVPDAAGWLGIAAVVLIGNVAAFPCYLKGITYIGPERGILYGFSEPVTAAILSTLFLGSPFTPWDAVGFGAVFAMMMLISVRRQPKTPRPAVS
jgi:drug/metabolite transporter (DMT)-like permease